MGIRERLLKPKVSTVMVNGESYSIRVVSGAERQAYIDTIQDEQAGKAKAVDVYACLVAAALCESDGTRVLADAAEAATVDAQTLEALFAEAHRLNFPDTEESKKNSQTTAS